MYMIDTVCYHYLEYHVIILVNQTNVEIDLFVIYFCN